MKDDGNQPLTRNRTEEHVLAIVAEYPNATLNEQLRLVMQRSKGNSCNPTQARRLLEQWKMLAKRREQS